MNLTEKNGSLACLTSASSNDDLLITTDKGVIIRMHVADISQTGRNTQGVILIKLKDNQNIVTVAVVDKEEDIQEEIKELQENQENQNNDTLSNTENTENNE